MINCTYILPTKYDLLVRQAFDIVEDFIDSELEDISEYGKLGVPQEDRLVLLKNYYYLINYMIYVRQKIDQYVADKGAGCITPEELTQFKELYKTDCIITNKVCQQYTNQIIDLFLALPDCSAPPTYSWVSADTCFETGGIEYAIGLTLQKLINGTVVETYYVDPEASSTDIQTLTGVDSTTADSLITSRFSEPDSPFCCNEPIYNAPVISVDEAASESFTISWESDATNYRILIEDELGQTQEVETTDTSVEFTGLTSNTVYNITVTAISCAGDNPSTIQFKTGPYTVTYILQGEIDNQITVTSPANSIDVPYNSTYTLSWVDTTEPFFIIDQVLRNGVDVTEESLVYTLLCPPGNIGESGQCLPAGNPANIKAAGNIEIPNIVEDTTLILTGRAGNTCTTLQLSINTETNALTLDVFV